VRNPVIIQGRGRPTGALNNYLDNSMGDLLVVKERIELAIKTQLHQLKYKAEVGLLEL